MAEQASHSILCRFMVGQDQGVFAAVESPGEAERGREGQDRAQYTHITANIGPQSADGPGTAHRTN